MSESESFRSLDIGGGTDALPEVIRQPDLQERHYNEMWSLRAVKEAQNNPEGQYYVVDPAISPDAAGRLSSEVPNIHFMIGKGENLPIQPESMDVIEVNHLFYPLIQAEVTTLYTSIDDKVEERANQIIADAPGMIDRKVVDEQVKPYRDDLEAEAKNALKAQVDVLESDVSQISDFEKYFQLLREAAKGLKPNGTLVLAEKKQRIDIIGRLLDAKEGQAFLKDTSLELVSIEDNEDPNRSSYAQIAANTQSKLESRGETEKAQRNQPQIMTLRRVAIKPVVNEQPE